MNDVVQNIIHFVVTFLFSLIFLMAAATVMVYLGAQAHGADAGSHWAAALWTSGDLFRALLDVGKLMLKEDVKPRKTDFVIFRLAPMVFFAPVITAFVVLPFSPYLTAGALGTGIIYYVALSSIDVIGVFMAGWGSNNKYALIGGLRSAAQMISYELPLVLALVPRGDACPACLRQPVRARRPTSMSAVSARSPSRRSWRRRCVLIRPGSGSSFFSRSDW